MLDKNNILKIHIKFKKFDWIKIKMYYVICIRQVSIKYKR